MIDKLIMRGPLQIPMITGVDRANARAAEREAMRAAASSTKPAGIMHAHTCSPSHMYMYV